MKKYNVFDCSMVELDKHHSDRKGNLTVVENEVHCIMADMPECFCEAILKLQDGKLWTRLATYANRLVTERFTLDALRNNRLNIYRQM